jgi:hypothetical protein
MGSPMSATLSHGDRDAVLVDALVTLSQMELAPIGSTAWR